MRAWLISEIYFDPITDSQFREIINNYIVILVATMWWSKIRLRLSSFPSKLLLSGGKVDRCFHDLVYVLQFFSPLFPLSSVPSFHPRPFSPPLSRSYSTHSYRTKPVVKPARKMVPRFSSLASLPTSSRRRFFSSTASCFCELFFLLARYYSPFFHRPQSFSATFRFASRRRYTGKM